MAELGARVEDRNDARDPDKNPSMYSSRRAQERHCHSLAYYRITAQPHVTSGIKGLSVEAGAANCDRSQILAYHSVSGRAITPSIGKSSGKIRRAVYRV